MKIRYFSLTEILVSIALLASLMTLSGAFFVKSLTLSRDSIKRTQRIQDIEIIKNHWREFNNRNVGEISIVNKQYFRGKMFVKYNNNKIIFHDLKGELKDPLPKNSSLQFSLEKSKNGKNIAILNILVENDKTHSKYRLVSVIKNEIIK